jgi:hypothetical protein
LLQKEVPYMRKRGRNAIHERADHESQVKKTKYVPAPTNLQLVQLLRPTLGPALVVSRL